MVNFASTKAAFRDAHALPLLCRSAKRFFCLGLTAAFITPVPVFAEDTTITMDVNLAVTPTCSITAATPQIYLGELSKPGSALLSFSFSCNTHFDFVLSSQHGGLKHHTRTPVQTPFVSLVPYTISYKVGTSGGPLTGACSSKDMVPGASGCRGTSRLDATAINQSVTLGFSWGLMGQYPVAGSYHDILTFKVSAGL